MSSKQQMVLLVILVMALITGHETIAQCAMCKATASSDLKNGGSIAKGLNFGILYLMAIPYIILIGLCFLFFRKQIAERVQLYRSKLFKS